MTIPAVRMTVRWHIPLGESRSIIDALHGVMIAARARRDCLGCSLATDAARTVGVRYAEEWADEMSLRRELRSDRFATLAALMESATEPPVVEIALPGGTRGLDYVEEVRATEPR
jgi:quinol monooxygenase YgiN